MRQWQLREREELNSRLNEQQRILKNLKHVHKVARNQALKAVKLGRKQSEKVIKSARQKSKERLPSHAQQQ